MYECESWTIKKAECRRTAAFELWCWRRLLRVPWTARRSNHPKGDQSWIFIGRTDAEAEAPILWPPDEKNWLTGKDPDAGRDWGAGGERGWQKMRWLDGITDLDISFEQAPGVGDGQGSLACYNPWGWKERNTTERLNWTTESQNTWCKTYRTERKRKDSKNSWRFQNPVSNRQNH